MHIKLFHNNYRHVNYFPAQKKLVTNWFGQIPEKEYLEYIDYTNEVIRIYDVKHFVINTKKAKSHFQMPSRSFIENILTKAYLKGAETLTLIQKKFGNSLFMKNAYQSAMESNGIHMEVEVIEPTSYRKAA